MLDRFFQLRAHDTTIAAECVGGLTTFVTLSYIIFVQPAVLATTGMDPGAVLTATCLASAFATLLMGLWANYPIAVAPAMGHNFYFALIVAGPVVSGGLGYTWPVALGANCIAGILFLLLSLLGVREKLLAAIPASLTHAIAAGIGLLIALVGFEWAGLVRAAPGTLVGLGDLHHPVTLIAIAGTLLTAILTARGNRAAILVGTLATAMLLVGSGNATLHGLIAAPPSLVPTFAKLDVAAALRPELAAVIFILFFLGLFDTIGTLVGVSEQAGLLKDGKLPRARQAMATDALGTIVGTMLGTSTLTAYVESAAGVQAGARTGLANVVTALLFLAALFFSPLARLAGEGVHVGNAVLYPVVAPALITVGSFMLRSIREIRFDDPPAALASFVTVVTMPFAFSITDGIALGFVTYAVLMLAVRRGREVHPLLYVFAILFLVRYALLR
ncbi:MAG: NCS2 family permease [Deltaproteobacteria bacterium]|nr:NCS2 family permease [Deltaproteobacteria bacterium]